MWCCCIVLALSLLSFAAAEEVKYKPCEDSRVTVIGDQFFASFSDAVNHSRYDEGRDDDYRDTMPRYILEYARVGNGSCYLDTVSPERDGLEFYKLMKYSMSFGALKNFVKHGGVGCITAIRNKITECVQKIVGVIEGADDKYFSLWKKTGVFIMGRTCRETEALKHCTLNAIRNEGYYKCEYEENNMMFVSTLFDYMLERCTRLVFKSDVLWLRSSMCSNDTSITHILLGLVLALGVLAFGFWIVHDCRSPNGVWKSLNEQIAMRRQ